MNDKKSLISLSLNKSEDEYRYIKAISYSAISKYLREGFKCISTLYEKEESPSLTFGSLVDTMVLSPDEFNKKFILSDKAFPSENIRDIIKNIYNRTTGEYGLLSDIPKEIILEEANNASYCMTFKDDTRVKKIIDNGESYYGFLTISNGKQIIDHDTYASASMVRDAINNTKFIEFFFRPYYPNGYDGFNQVQFITDFDGVPFKCMFDRIIVSHKDKVIIPVDLKTCSVPEYEFHKNFVKYHYDVQARLYTMILQKVISTDDYYKDFKIADFDFVCVNKESLTPICWKFNPQIDKKEVEYENGINFCDPIKVGAELYSYLINNPKVPSGIDLLSSNNIEDFIKMM